MNRKGAIQLLAVAVLLLVAILGIIIGLAFFKIDLFGNIVYEYRIGTLSPTIMVITDMTYKTHYGHEILGNYFGTVDGTNKLRDEANTPDYVTDYRRESLNTYKKIFSNPVLDAVLGQYASFIFKRDCYALLKIDTGINEVDSFIRENCDTPIQGYPGTVFIVPIALPYNPNEHVTLIAWLIQQKTA